MEHSVGSLRGFKAFDGPDKGMISDFESIVGQTHIPGPTHTGKKSLTKISHTLLQYVHKTANGGRIDKACLTPGIGCDIHKQLS